MALESAKAFAVEWLDWAAKYATEDPKEFFTRRNVLRAGREKSFFHSPCLISPAVFLIMLPLFAVSSILAFLLLREMQKEEKKNAKKGVHMNACCELF